MSNPHYHARDVQEDETEKDLDNSLNTSVLKLMEEEYQERVE